MKEFLRNWKWTLFIGLPFSVLGALPGLFIHTTPEIIFVLAPYVAFSLMRNEDFTAHWYVFVLTQCAYYFLVVSISRFLWGRLNKKNGPGSAHL